jgi:undecaprenyl phosphate-alpha-L-ara4FN deformylase
MQLALKIDVDTYRGTREGIPALLKCLDKHGVRGTFLFSLGPDHTGRAITRVFRRGFFSKVRRTSVLSHIGIKTALYGTFLPGPDIGRRCAATLKSVRAAGHEVGIHCWNHVRWQDGVAGANDQWTERQMRKALDRFAEVFGEPAKTHGAAGWQMNDAALRLTAQLGFDYCSDTRGHSPFLPMVDNQVVNCAQLPTTLPTLDELIGVDGINASNVANFLLKKTSVEPPAPHVYTLHTELEGLRLLPVFDALLAGWRAQGYALHPLRQVFATMESARLPVHRVEMGTVPGRSGTLLKQAASAAHIRPNSMAASIRA